jgi:predicted alpha/beta hydrolase family esterase
MKRAIIIHGWEDNSHGHWIPWVKEELEKKGFLVVTPDMPNTKNPTLTQWMETLESLQPDKDTLLIGHSLSNALILKYLEKPSTSIKGAFLVAAWDWLMEDIREFHITFFENGFDYKIIKQTNVPITIINSTTDPWIDFEKSKLLAEKIGATFVPIENAGHFTVRDGFTAFPTLVDLIE